MAGPDIRKYDRVGLHYVSETVHLSEMIDAHLDHRRLMLVPEPEYRKRHAYLVIKIAFGLERIELLLQHRSHKLLRARFADRADDADDLHVLHLLAVIPG